jgi:hypothetical protein
MEETQLKSELQNQELDVVFFEPRFFNVAEKANDPYYQLVKSAYGDDRIVYNGYKQRTNHEVQSGIKVVKKRRINIDVDIVNLPFTVTKRGKPAETAFTDRTPEHRFIYLVPDHTPTRIMNDTAYHRQGIESLLAEKSVNPELAMKWLKEMEKLDVGERVAATLIHEYGHILTYQAMDKAGINDPYDAYVWLDESGYLDNCSERIVGFSQGGVITAEDAFRQINIAMEQLAEDYRLSVYVKSEHDACPLPSCISYKEDLINPHKFLKGVEIMTKLLNLDAKAKKAIQAQHNMLDAIMPFGEANRSVAASQFGHGEVTPLTKDQKEAAKAALRNLLGR